MKKILSKSKIQKHKQCKKQLWLSENRAVLSENSDISEIIMSQGSEFGDLIKANYKNSYDIEEKSTSKAINETNNLIDKIILEDKDAVVFEAAFKYLDVIVRVDVLEYFAKLKKWNITEVKSGNIFKNTDVIKENLLFDAAIQYFIVNNSSIEINDIFLGYPNSEFILKEEGLFNDLLSKELISDKVKKIDSDVKLAINDAFKNINSDNEPKDKIGSHCKKPHSCNFINYCSKAELFENEKIDIPVWFLGGSPTVKIVKSLMDKGYRDLSEVPDELLKTDIHIKMKEVSQTKKNFIDPKLINFLKNEPWPRYFLDYETVSSPYPLFINTNPGGRIPFQYSIHKWEEYDKKPIAYHYVHDNSSDPQNILGKKICEIITEKECGIYTWHGRSVEAPITRKLLKFTKDPILNDQLNIIIKQMMKGDLLPYFKDNFYMLGQRNWSVKSIADNLLKHNPYSNLNITGGAEAMDVYHQFRKNDCLDKEKKKQDLIDYCAVDTSVMIDIWKATLKIL
ncbi:DUF2779 domain-containing protein [Alphaproteobacteria bacterium]|nr:DUF2779 domain-containing protein [Alphaproteobacteria bacterium]